jgi:hypothetical protein
VGRRDRLREFCRVSLATALVAYAIAIWLAATYPYSDGLVRFVMLFFLVGTFFFTFWVDGD